MQITVPGLGIKRLRDGNRAAVGQFVRENSQYLKGRVLDFGCGLQPYKDLIVGEYTPYDPGYNNSNPPPIDGQFDAILVTQVLQFTENPRDTIAMLRKHLVSGGYLVITYHSSWYEAQQADTWRISSQGMERMIGCKIIKHEPVTELLFDGFPLRMTYGIVACLV